MTAPDPLRPMTAWGHNGKSVVTFMPHKATRLKGNCLNPAEQAEDITLLRSNGWTFEAIAGHLSMSVSTVRKHNQHNSVKRGKPS